MMNTLKRWSRRALKGLDAVELGAGLSGMGSSTCDSAYDESCNTHRPQVCNNQQRRRHQPNPYGQNAHLIKDACIFKTVRPCLDVDYGPRVAFIAQPSCKQLHVKNVLMTECQPQSTVHLFSMMQQQQQRWRRQQQRQQRQQWQQQRKQQRKQQQWQRPQERGSSDSSCCGGSRGGGGSRAAGQQQRQPAAAAGQAGQGRQLLHRGSGRQRQVGSPAEAAGGRCGGSS